MRISLIQMDLTGGDPVHNLKHACSLIQQALRQQIDTVVLPEMWNTSFFHGEFFNIGDGDATTILQEMETMARLNNVNIVAGSIANVRDKKVYNTAYIIDRNGSLQNRYDKIHLIGLMGEDKYITRGGEICNFMLDGIDCGLIICYDLRFPELARSLVLRGAKIMFVPAQWPHPRLHHWRTLLMARAIENQIYVVGVNGVGKVGSNTFFGHSMVVNPWGEIVAEADEKEEIITVDLNLNMVEEVRGKMRIFADRVPNLYQLD